jgi:tetratricopeptide (TPR) repeat protein
MLQAHSKLFTKIACAVLLLNFALPLQSQSSSTNPDREVAIKLLQEKQYAEAVKAWRKFLSDTKNQQDTEAWMYLGIAQYRNNELDLAREAFKKTIKLNSKSELAHSNYASVLFAAHKLKDAEGEVKETLKLNPLNQNALYLRGVIRSNKGEYAKALQDADLILKSSPQFAPAYLLKAQAITRQLEPKKGKPASDFPPEWKSVFLESAQYLEKYLQLNPTDPDANGWREQMNALRLYGGSENSLGCEKATATLHPEIFSKEKARYTDEARNNGIRGTIRLRAIFDVDGQVKYILPMNYLGGGLTNEAIRATQKIRFRPAIKDGKPVCVSMLVEFSFELL